MTLEAWRLVGFTDRLRGLTDPAVQGLVLLERCPSIHTFGMDGPCDVAWLDDEGRVLRTDLGVPPGRVRCGHGARTVLERRSPTGPVQRASPWLQTGQMWRFRPVGPGGADRTGKARKERKPWKRET